MATRKKVKRKIKAKSKNTKRELLVRNICVGSPGDTLTSIENRVKHWREKAQAKARQAGFSLDDCHIVVQNNWRGLEVTKNLILVRPETPSETKKREEKNRRNRERRKKKKKQENDPRYQEYKKLKKLFES